MKKIVFIGLLGFMAACSNDTVLNDPSLEQQYDESYEDETTPEEQARRDSIQQVYDDVEATLKEKARDTWPNDYTTQEHWVKQQLVDFSYMNRIPDEDPIKQKAERSWPNDYSTQKYWYDEQIAAKERMN